MKRMNKNVINIGAIVFGIVVVVVSLWIAKGKMSGAFPALNGGMYDKPVAADGVSYLVPKNEIYDAGRGEDDAPALVNPVFVANSAAGFYADDLSGVAVVIDGDARFYPHQVLNWHEVVEDTVGGQRIVVAHATFCGSDAVYDASNGITLRNAGKVYNNCTLLSDAEGNLWNATTGVQVVGKNAGATLTAVSADVMTLKEWKERYPAGKVLSENTSFARLYKRHPFGGYDTADALYFPVNATHCATQDGASMCEPSLKAVVMATMLEKTPVAFAEAYVRQEGVVAASAEGQKAVAFYDAKNRRVRVYDASVDGRVLTFRREEARLVDAETGSEWGADGVAVRGELAGKRLAPRQSVRMFAFAFSANYPQGMWPGRPEMPVKDDAAVEGQTIEVPAAVTN